MWYHQEIDALSAQIGRLTRLRDQCEPCDGILDADDWERHDWDGYDWQIAELVKRREAMQASVGPLVAATTDIAATSAVRDGAYQRLEDHSCTSRRLARKAVLAGLLALVTNLLWIPSMWLSLVIIVFIAVSVGVGIRRVYRYSRLEDLACSVHEEHVEAQVRLQLMLDRIEDGQPTTLDVR